MDGQESSHFANVGDEVRLISGASVIDVTEFTVANLVPVNGDILRGGQTLNSVLLFINLRRSCWLSTVAKHLF